MSYETIIRTDPDALYMFGDAPHVDRSRKRAANLTLSNTIHPLPVFNGGRLSLCPPTFEIPSQITGQVWSVAAVVKAHEEGKIFEFKSSGGTGLYHAAGELVFSVKHVDGGVTSASIPYNPEPVVDVTCVTDTKSISLYVSGVRVASSEIDNTSGVVAGDTIVFGDTSAKISIGNIVTWDKVMRWETVAILAESYRRFPSRRSISEVDVANLFTPELLSRNESISIPVATQSLGTIEVGPGHYVSDTDPTTGESLMGEVYFPYYSQEESAGVAMYWNSDRYASVEVSTNGGGSWQAVTSGQIVADTLAPSAVDVSFRVSFPQGATLTPFISGLRVVEFNDTTMHPRALSHRQGVVVGDLYTPDTAHDPQMHGDGMRFTPTSVFEILPEDSEVNTNTTTLEIVFSVLPSDMTGTKYIVNNSPEHSSNLRVVSGKLTFTGFSTVYVNGTSASSGSLTLTPGMNYHVIANYTTPNNAKITFGSEGTSISGPVSTFAFRHTAVSAAEALRVFNSYMKYPTYRTSEIDELTISDSPVSISSHDWTVRGT